MSAVLESETIAPEWLLERIDGRTAELADAVADLIRSGELSPGDRLPTVRALAKATDLSVGAVVTAWGRVAGQAFLPPSAPTRTTSKARPPSAPARAPGQAPPGPAGWTPAHRGFRQAVFS